MSLTPQLARAAALGGGAPEQHHAYRTSHHRTPPGSMSCFSSCPAKLISPPCLKQQSALEKHAALPLSLPCPVAGRPCPACPATGHASIPRVELGSWGNIPTVGPWDPFEGGVCSHSHTGGLEETEVFSQREQDLSAFPVTPCPLARAAMLSSAMLLAPSS